MLRRAGCLAALVAGMAVVGLSHWVTSSAISGVKALGTPLAYHATWTPSERGVLADFASEFAWSVEGRADQWTCWEELNHSHLNGEPFFTGFPDSRIGRNAGFWREELSIWRMIARTAAEGDVAAEDRNGMTLLMLAAACGRCDLVRLLAERGADINRRMLGDPSADGPLSWAVCPFSPDGKRKSPLACQKTAAALIEHGADIRTRKLMASPSSTCP